MSAKRSVFYLSDRTGITAETLGRSLLTQFDGIKFEHIRWPFLDSEEKAREAVEQIDDAAEADGVAPLVFCTIINRDVREAIRACRGVLFDFFDTFTGPLEKTLGQSSLNVSGRSHGMGDYATYASRIEALNFALANDDGSTTSNYPGADIILLGVSRSGKTPTSLYLALQFGILAANYPLTEEDLESTRLPQRLRPFRDKLYGLTIDPERLHKIRSERRPEGRYATMRQCEFEIEAAEAMYRAERIRHINTTAMSIEEIATTLIQSAGLRRRLDI